MNDRRCPHCQQVFQPAPYHPQQLVCSQPPCQRQRRRDYHREKIRSDSLYAQVVQESRKSGAMHIPTTSSSIGSGTRKRSSGTANSSRSVTNATASSIL